MKIFHCSSRNAGIQAHPLGSAVMLSSKGEQEKEIIHFSAVDKNKNVTFHHFIDRMLCLYCTGAATERGAVGKFRGELLWEWRLDPGLMIAKEGKEIELK